MGPQEEKLIINPVVGNIWVYESRTCERKIGKIEWQDDANKAEVFGAGSVGT